MKLAKCPKCKNGFIEEGEDYCSETHIAVCNNRDCAKEFWINYKRVYDLKALEETP
jgi:plasmid maintenance system antidote protein VapI